MKIDMRPRHIVERETTRKKESNVKPDVATRDTEPLTERFAIRCTAEEKSKLERLGGSAWIRKMIRES